MKKLVLILATLAVTLPGMAQDKYVTSALASLKSQNYEDAKSDIDKAAAHPESKDKPKTLFAKAQVYYTIMQTNPEKNKLYYRDAAQALFKLIEVKPDYEKQTVDQLLALSAFLYFNDAVKDYNDQKYDQAVDLMKNAVKVIELKAGGKRFEGMPDTKSFDTLSANAYQTLGNSYYYNKKYAEAIPYLLKVKNNPITKTPTAYENLIYAYQNTGNKAEEQAMIKEGRAAFPDDVTIKHMELNSLMASGKQEELIKSLEESAVKEPGNADILFNLATTYLGMANPKDGKKPANAVELTSKSEDAFLRALKISPDNPGYNYNLGALYYNQATDYNEQMNAITGSSAADNAKYDALKVKRDAMFGKSTPFFEKAYSTLKANAANLSQDDRNTYRSCMIALKEVYARTNQMDKSKAMKAEYESFK